MDRLDKMITERKQHMNIIKFEDLPISDDIKRAVIEMGFEEPSPIQSQSIPVILSCKDVIGQAQTGTGKTADLCKITAERRRINFKPDTRKRHDGYLKKKQRVPLLIWRIPRNGFRG